MGLDMYLNRMPRYKRCNGEDVDAIEGYLWYKKRKAERPNEMKMSLEEWCGVPEDRLPPEDAIEFYAQFYEAHDDDGIFKRIMEPVGYWRKENAIHNWFVNNVQDGDDDCRYHREVTARDLRDLIKTCEEVISKARLVPGKMHVSTSFRPDGETVKNYEDGLVVANPEVCEELLPTTSGCFFGSTSYNEWYIRGLMVTIQICENVLSTTDFNKQMVYYRSSW